MTEKMLDVTELFYSLQGEGRYIGVPSVFLRLWGCPFKCQGFGQSRNWSEWKKEDDMPHKNVDLIARASTLEDLPVPTIGCDSSYSWAKETKHLTSSMTPIHAAMAIHTLLKGSRLPESPDGRHLVLTGGEPLITKNQPAILQMLEYISNHFPTLHITFETNGYYPLTSDLAHFFNRSQHEVTFSVSPKLPLSGELTDRALQPTSVMSYAQVRNSYIYAKYVVRDFHDLKDVEIFNEAYLEAGVPLKSVYLMPEGAETLATRDEIVKLCLEYGYRYSPRLHIDLFGNKWGT